MPVTIPQTETILKSYFQTGDKPTQEQFEELIGTMFYLFQQAMDAAESAQDDAADARARQPQALVKATYPGSGSVYTVDAGAVNISSITIIGAEPINNPEVKIIWTTPFANTNYKVIVTPFSTTFADNVLILEQTQAYITVKFRNSSTVASRPQFHLAAFN